MHASILLVACWLALLNLAAAAAEESDGLAAESPGNSPLRPIPAEQVRLEPVPAGRSSPPVAVRANGLRSADQTGPAVAPADVSEVAEGRDRSVEPGRVDRTAEANEPGQANVPEIVTHLAEPIVVRPKSAPWKPAPAATISGPTSVGGADGSINGNTAGHAADGTAANTAQRDFAPTNSRAISPSNGSSSKAAIVRPSSESSSVPAAIRTIPAVGQPLREESLSPAQRIAGLPPPRELGTLIRPVNFQQSDVAGGTALRTTAGLLLQTAMIPPDDPEWALSGQAAPLAAIIDRAAERSQRVALIRAYWRTHADVCAYNWAVEEGAFIAGVSTTPQPSDQSLLMAARLESQAHLQRTRLAATASQVDLAEVSRFAARGLPLPSDTPLVTAYQTKFDKIFANRTPPAGLRRVAVSIPLQKQLLDTTAEAVAAATDAVRELNDEFQQGQTSLVSLLDAHRRLRKQRLEFLDSVRTYNELVADYAVALGGSVNTDTLVSMLIPVSTAARTAQATRMEPTVARDFRDPRDTSRTYSNVPTTGVPTTNGAVRGASGVGTPASGFAPANPVGTAPGSNRAGNWMSPRTTIRDGSVQGSANVAPSLNGGQSNWNGSVRREPVDASRPASSFQTPGSPTFDSDPAPRFTPPPSSFAPPPGSFTPPPASFSPPTSSFNPPPASFAAQPNAAMSTPRSAQPVMNAVPTIRANPATGAGAMAANGFPSRGPAAAPESAPPSSFAPPAAPVAPPPTAPLASVPPPSVPLPNDGAPASEVPGSATPVSESPVSIPADAGPPPTSPPTNPPAGTFESPGGGFVPPPDGFVPPEPGAQLGKPE